VVDRGAGGGGEDPAAVLPELPRHCPLSLLDRAVDAQQLDERSGKPDDAATGSLRCVRPAAAFSGNEYLAASCDCGSPPSTDIWKSVTIEKIPGTGVGQGEREGKLLTAKWCAVHGSDYCDAVLAGKRSRPNVMSLVKSALQFEYRSAARLAAKQFRESAAVSDARAIRERDQGAMRAGLRNIRR
jgi:hypothetical protein